MSVDVRPVSERTFTGRQWCAHYLPRLHAAKECGCYKREQQGVLIIQPRSGRQIRRV